MLFINRNSEDWNWLLKTKLYGSQKKYIEDNLSNSKSAKDFPSLRAPTEIPNTMEQLKRDFKGKCAYCENKAKYFSYHRPQFNSKQNLEASSEENYYYVWLSWEWFNFYLVCQACTNSKGTQFPLEGRRAEFESAPLERINNFEQPLLLDPCVDNPNLHLEFSADGTVKERSQRGRVTINTLNLNRADLCRKRKDIAEKMKKDFQLALRSLSSDVLSNDSSNVDDSKNFFEALSQHRNLECSFAAMRHQLLLSWLRFLREYLEKDEEIDENNRLAKLTRRRNILLLDELIKQNKSGWNDLLLYLESWFFMPVSNGEMPQIETQLWLIETLKFDENSIGAELINKIEALSSALPSESPLTLNNSSILQELRTALRNPNLAVLSERQRYIKMINAILQETTNYLTEEVKILRIPLKALLAFLQNT